jgi:hypothetical protein
MKELLALIVCIVAPATVFAADGAYKVRYIGGSPAMGVRRGTSLTVSIDSGLIRLTTNKKDVAAITASSVKAIRVGPDYISLNWDDGRESWRAAFIAKKSDYGDLLTRLEGATGKTAIGSRPAPGGGSGLTFAQQSPDSRFAAIQEIVILPALDSRSDKNVSVNFKKMRESAQRILKFKRYYTTQSDNMGDVGGIVETNLGSASPEWIKRLGPPEARWIMVIGLGGLQGARITTAATVFGFLYDKESASLIWQARGAGVFQPTPYRSPTDPLADVTYRLLFAGSARDGIVGNALFNLLSGPSGLPNMPKRPKKRK